MIEIHCRKMSGAAGTFGTCLRPETKFDLDQLKELTAAKDARNAELSKAEA